MLFLPEVYINQIKENGPYLIGGFKKKPPKSEAEQKWDSFGDIYIAPNKNKGPAFTIHPLLIDHFLFSGIFLEHVTTWQFILFVDMIETWPHKYNGMCLVVYDYTWYNYCDVHHEQKEDGCQACGDDYQFKILIEEESDEEDNTEV